MRMHAEGGPRAKVVLIKGDLGPPTSKQAKTLLTKKRTHTHVCVWCEREKCQER